MTTIVVVAAAGMVLTAPDVGAPDGWLGEQRERWLAFRQVTDRDAFLAARVLARCLLTAAAGATAAGPGECSGATGPVDPRGWTIQQSCPSCDRAHGRPTVVGTGLHVSWAHSGDLVAAAVSTSPVGVDVERVGTRLPPLPAGAAEHAWLRWTRMEALVKRGDGDLDSALGWPLDGPAALDGRPVRSFLPHHRRGGILTDVVARDGSWVATVAAAEPAALLDPYAVLQTLRR